MVHLISFFNTGWVWSRNQMVSEHWEIEVIFRVTGRGRIGADGLVRLLVCYYINLKDIVWEYRNVHQFDGRSKSRDQNSIII